MSLVQKIIADLRISSHNHEPKNECEYATSSCEFSYLIHILRLIPCELLQLLIFYTLLIHKKCRTLI